MAQIREIKKRMVAVNNIQRITKTMQMIATARFTAALQRSKATQPYTAQVKQMVGQVAAAAGEIDNPLLKPPANPTGREMMLTISSDRGLCGAYNGNVIRSSLRSFREREAKGQQTLMHVSGKKAVGVFKFQRIDVSEHFTFGDMPKYEDVERLASRYIESFIAGEFDAVRVSYMRYESNSRQIPEVMQLLPLEPVSPEGDGADAGPSGGFEFSPSAEELLNDLLPLTVKTALFQAFNDSVVSEQIMRMIAMKAATENAGDLRKSLGRKFNRARQAAITTELMEVISGSAALE